MQTGKVNSMAKKKALEESVGINVESEPLPQVCIANKLPGNWTFQIV